MWPPPPPPPRAPTFTSTLQPLPSAIAVLLFLEELLLQGRPLAAAAAATADAGQKGEKGRERKSE